MVQVFGTPYVKRDACPPRTACPTACPPPPCNSGRVLSAGMPYIKRPWYSPYFSYPRPAYVRPVSVVHSDTSAASGVVAAVAIVALLAIAVATSVSRDCRFVETKCSLPNFFGEQVCQDIWDCKW